MANESELSIFVSRGRRNSVVQMASPFRQHGKGHRIRFHRPAGLANVGDVVDVDPETGHTHVCLS